MSRIGLKRYSVRDFGFEIIMIAIAAVFSFPIYILVVLSFKSPNDWASPLSLPFPPYLGNFSEAWEKAQLGAAISASVLVVVVALLVLVAMGACAAYFLARATRSISNLLYYLFLAGIVLPFQLALIPVYQLMRDLSLLGTPWSLILLHCGVQLPLTIFLYTGFIRSIPRSYEEAARIDGANQLQVFLFVVLPMLRPVTGTVLMIAGVFIWNDFLTALLLLFGSEWQTVPVQIYSFVDIYITDWGVVFASLLIGISPIMIVFLLLQKHMIRGFASGVKG